MANLVEGIMKMIIIAAHNLWINLQGPTRRAERDVCFVPGI